MRREDHLRGIAATSQSLTHCRAINILGYHVLGEAKRARLGITLPEEQRLHASDMSREEVEVVVGHLRDLGVDNVTSG